MTPVMIEPNARIAWPRAEIATQLAIPLPVTSGKVVRAKATEIDTLSFSAGWWPSSLTPQTTRFLFIAAFLTLC